MPQAFECPVCTYNGLKKDSKEKLHEICPSCGTQFGYSDSGPASQDFYHGMLRERYITNGCKWYSRDKPRPEDFNPRENMWRKHHGY